MSTDNFQWDDNSVMEFLRSVYDRHTNPLLPEINKFKASKQKPKDWEILAYEHSGRIYKKNNLGDWATTFDAPVHKLLLHPEDVANIHSVRRLSDGEVFTVGDRVEHRDGVYSVVIKEFKPYNEKMWFLTTFRAEDCKDLQNFHKPKQLLFTTEDGKPVYKDDEVYKVSLNDFRLSHRIAGDGVEQEQASCKLFSTKEAAEEYKLMNKPMLSVQEVMNRLHAYFGNPIYAFDNIKSFAKSKLQ